MNMFKLRAWWADRQGILDRCLDGRSSAEVLATTGWARAVGGSNPYLTLFSRGGIRRAGADRALAELEIQELPAARGCTYVVPRRDFALALRVGQAFAGRDMNTARKLGVTDTEVDRLCEKIVASLKAPLSPEELREAVGSAARNLGAEGKKKGLTTTMPLALGRLQAEGEIRRIPTNGRLDQQRYQYALWRPNPLSKYRTTPAEANTELASRYFRWIGPAALAEFQWFSGLSMKGVKAAVQPLGLVACPDDESRLMHAQDVDAYTRFRPPSGPQYTLVSSLDGISLLRRDVAGLIDPGDAKRKVLGDGGSKPLGGLADFPDHAILDRGRLIGLWEFDPETQSIAWWAFGVDSKSGSEALLTEAVARTEAFVRDDLADARSFSLDSPKSRSPRIEALRTARRVNSPPRSPRSQRTLFSVSHENASRRP